MLQERKCIDNWKTSIPTLPLTRWVMFGQVAYLLQFHNMRILELKRTLKAIEFKFLILPMRKLCLDFYSRRVGTKMWFSDFQLTAFPLYFVALLNL